MDDEGMQIDPSWTQFLRDFEVPLIFGTLLLLVTATTLGYYFLYRPWQRKSKLPKSEQPDGRRQRKKRRSRPSLVEDLKKIIEALEKKPRQHRSFRPLGAEQLPPLKEEENLSEASPEHRPTGI
jgi:hypothetical protein